MKKYLPFLFLVVFFLNALTSSAQVPAPEIRKFRFYEKKNKTISTNNKKYKVHIESGSFYHKKVVVTKTEDTYSCYSERDEPTIVQIKKRRDSMKIHTYCSLEDIPFRKGSYVIPRAYQALFMSFKPEKSVKIINRNIRNFEVEKFPDGQIWSEDKSFSPDTLQPIPCQFWQKGLSGQYQKMREQDFPYYSRGFYEDKTNGILYLWDDGNGYTSEDRGRNWQQIRLPEELIDSLYRNKLLAPPYLSQEQSFKKNGKIYPLLSRMEGDKKTLYKVNSSKKKKEPLLHLMNTWYTRLSVYENIWSISAQGYMLVSRDEGKSWKYYVGENYNTEVLEIIDGKYFFDGLRLYWIPEIVQSN
jgi:hypothetical protein